MSRFRTIVLSFAGLVILLVGAQTRSKGSIPTRHIDFNCPEEWINDLLWRYAVLDTPPPNPLAGPGDPTSRPPSNPMSLGNPGNVETVFVLDEDGTGYYVYEKVGDINVRPPSHISMRQYLDWRKNNSVRDHWKERSTGSTAIGTNNPLDFKFATNSEALKDIFGGGSVEIRPTGTALLDIGGEFNRSQNPSLPIRQQRTGNLKFDQQIQLNVVGKIGEKLRLNASWDTQATFDFENQLKLEYTGTPNEILQKVEAGNVSLPLNGSLISGGQNLFGIKTALKFGPLMVTTIASQQKGKTQAVTATGGAQVTEFRKKGDEYDYNRHFFLSHYFRSRYEYALKGRPNINSPITITRCEVWITNNNSSSTVDNRNAVGFVDLGETERAPVGTLPTQRGVVWNPNLIQATSYPDNRANDLYATISADSNYSEKSKVDQLLINNLGFQNGTDFIKVENMRKLNANEFTYHPQLGYVTLNSALQQNQVLFVAYEYRLGGEVHQVGDFTQDPGKQANNLNSNVLFLKMLKPDKIQPRSSNKPFPTWDLMMKNIYSIGGYGLSRDNFRLDVIYDSRSQAGDIGYLPTGAVKNIPLIQVFGLDTLQNNNMSGPDNFFDYMDRITIIPDKGMIIFPVLEPFGDHLRAKLRNVAEDVDKYVFDTLYSGTPQDAINYASDKNRYFLKGSYQGSSGSEISLNSINVAPGSVKVTANGITLVEGTDYNVDYSVGKVTILNQGILTSGQELKVTFETNSLFGIETKTMVGSRFDFTISKDFQLGGTILHMNEKPLTNKIVIGDEPTANTIWGLDGIFRRDSKFLTRMIDKLPFLQTNEVSSIQAQGEFAQLLPGHPRAIEVNGEKGIAYLDDFESAKTTFDLMGFKAWTLASFPGDNGNNGMVQPAPGWNAALADGFTRAKLSWYSIDPSFYYGSTDEVFPEADLSDHYMRQITPNEVFPNQTRITGDNLLRTFDLHYMPKQRGMYNYQVDPALLNDDGTFKNPEDMWAGVQRRTSGNTDFEAANFEFIEFWLMDPFDKNKNNGGDFYLNLGGVSEDVLKDNVRNFENGLPGDPADSSTVGTTEWGHYPLTTPPTTSFSNDPAARPNQDVGLDGLDDNNERLFFAHYLDTMAQLFPGNPKIVTDANADPSNDDYAYFRGSNLDGKHIVERYLPWNGTEGNTPLNSNQNGYSTQGSPNPDSEDLNLNTTLNTSERYWEYKMHFSPNDMQVGKNYIVDVNPAVVNLVNNKTDTINWYQFRIPLVSGKSIGDIQDFKAIEFIRMYMKGWNDEMILRFAKFQLVSTTWRTSRDYMGPESDTLLIDPQPGSFFNIGTVNIEENGNRQPFPYVLPPGIRRQQQVASTQPGLLQNEQALVMKTCGLQDGDGRGAFKLVNYDMRSYKRLKMWVHAENIENSGQEFNPGELRAFVRLGSDIKNNYYEYEIPLKAALEGATDSLSIWNNQFDVELAQLAVAKAKRNEQGFPVVNRYQYDIQNDPDRVGHRIYVVGTPKTSDVKAMMVGIRNENDGQGPICAEVWVNELRLVDFDETSGWAANARATIKLADFANITVSGSIKTPGFGALEQKINNRSRETTRSFDVAGNFNMGKFFPKNWGIQLPLYLSYGERVVDPKFNPLESDVKMVNYLQEYQDLQDRDSVLQSLQDRRTNKSISLNNIRKVRIQKPGNSKSQPKTHPWDIENLTLSLAYNETFSSNYTTLARWQKNHKASVGYAYNFDSKPIEPFKNAKHKNPITMFNFNPLPKTIGFNLALDRQYEENHIRQSAGTIALAPTVMKRFTINRTYNLRWDLTKSLSFNYTATNAGRVDEPLGIVTKSNRNQIYESLLNFGVIQDSVGIDSIGRDKIINFGRNMNFSQQIGLNYLVPFDKFKPTNWINATLAYQGGYNWLTAPDNNLSLGNQINNSNTITANTRLNLENLYNKVGFLKRMLEEQKAGPKGDDGKPGGPQASGKPVPKPTPKPGEAEQDSTKDEDSFVILKAIGKQVVKTLLSIRNVDFNYSTNSATSIAGWMPRSDVFGLDTRFQYRTADSLSTVINNTLAPGIPFVIGWQPDLWRAQQVGDTAMLTQFAQNGWISNNSTLSTPFTQTWGQNITGRTSVTPFRDFKIDLNVTKTNSVNYSEQFHFVDSLDRQMHDNRLFTGQYSISYIFIGTAFEKNVDQSRSYLELQDQARGIVSSRLASDNPEYATFLSRANVTQTVVDGQYLNGYYRNSQEVLVPSFLAAYGVGKAQRIGLTPFPAIPLPNWNVNYNGLGRIPALKKHFTSISIKHAYRGTYNVGGYTSNVRFTGNDTTGYTSNYFPVTISNGDSVYNIQSQYVLPQVGFTESFAPLAGINLNFKNGLTAGLDLKMNRSVNLSLGNQQLTETRGKDFSLSVSYRKDKLEKTLVLFGRTVNLKNALNTRLEISLRDTKTRNRKLDFQGNSDFTAGNFMFIVKPSVDYVVNQKLNVRFYIEHSRNRPAISTSFPSSYTAVGFQVRFTL